MKPHRALVQSLLVASMIFSSLSCAISKIDYPFAPQQPFVQTYKVFGSFTGKRILLTHGIWGNDNQYESGSLKDLRDGLVAHGYQVITFSYPYTEPSILYDAGLAYRNEYLNFLEWVITDTESRFGAATELDIGGYSFGGLHAIIGAANLPFNRYLAMLPVTNLTATNLLGDLSDTYFDAFQELPALGGKPGMVVTSHSDQILGYQNAQAFAVQAGADYHDYAPGNGHSVTPEMVQDILAAF